MSLGKLTESFLQRELKQFLQKEGGDIQSSENVVEAGAVPTMNPQVFEVWPPSKACRFKPTKGAKRYAPKCPTYR